MLHLDLKVDDLHAACTRQLLVLALFQQVLGSILLKLIRTNKPERTLHINEYYSGKLQVKHFAFEKLSPDFCGGGLGRKGKSRFASHFGTGSLLSDKTLKFLCCSIH